MRYSVLLLLPLLAACGVAANAGARSEMLASKEALKKCLQETPANCKSAKEIYELDMRTFSATSSALGNSQNINLNTKAP